MIREQRQQQEDVGGEDSCNDDDGSRQVATDTVSHLTLAARDDVSCEELLC